MNKYLPKAIPKLYLLYKVLCKVKEMDMGVMCAIVIAPLKKSLIHPLYTNVKAYRITEIL